ncbi:MAG: helix-turn-helix domain-containing protein, partial [Vallitaleaceae bacterium]|nr:helix-turn-helix domain-containing protein [Vallitaleaceae bacterium]
MNEFGLKLKSLRKSRGINQKELADYLGVAQNTVANYENGKRQPNTQTLKKIVTYFGSVAAYLLEEDEGQVLSSRTLDYEGLQKEFASRLTKDQSEEAKELLFSLLPLESEELVGIYENIFVPTLYHIGILWEQGQISVAKEHLYSNLITNMMQHLSNQYFYGTQQGIVEEEAKEAAVCVNIYGDLHTIGLRMIHDYFRILGIRSYYLGANVPTDSLIEFLISHKAKYLAISVTLDQYV